MRWDGWLAGYGMATALYDVPPLEHTARRCRLSRKGGTVQVLMTVQLAAGRCAGWVVGP
jgi:hypothetical protein